MENIKKHRKQLSYFTIIALLLNLTAILVARFNNIDYKIQTIILTLLFVDIYLIYYSGKKLYKYLKKEIKTIKDKSKPENITINQVINPEEKTTLEHLKQNEERFNSLINQFSKCQDASELSNMFLSKMAKEFEIVQGLIYQYCADKELFEPIADYAFYGQEKPSTFKTGEGLNGQVVRDMKTMFIQDLPSNYRKIVSGLGKREPKYLAIIPVISNEQTIALVELALFYKMEPDALTQLEKILNNLSSHFEK